MASSKTGNDAFKDSLRQCVEKLLLKDGSVPAPFSGWPNSKNGSSVLNECLDRSNGRLNRSRVPEEWESPRQAAIGKQGGGVSKQHRLSRKRDIRILCTNERDFKALVSKHTCMPSFSAPDVMQPTSPQINSSISTLRSLSQPACGFMSQPASPETPTSLQSKGGFNSPPMSPLSQPRLSSISPSRSDGKGLCVKRSAQTTPQLNSSFDLYPHLGCTVPQCASAPCSNNTVVDNQVGWPQGTRILDLAAMEKFLMKDDKKVECEDCIMLCAEFSPVSD